MNLPIIDKPFCQIFHRTIDQKTCLEQQGISPPEECFGCSSSYRQCSSSRNTDNACQNKVAFPEVSFCQECLHRALENEKELLADAPGTRCHCGERNIFYDDYKLCLHCTVQEYNAKGGPPMPDNPSPDQKTTRRRRGWVKTPREEWIKFLDQAVDLAEARGALNPKLLRTKFPSLGTTATNCLINEMTKQGILGAPRVGVGRPFLKRPPASQPSSNGQPHSLTTSAPAASALKAKTQVLPSLRKSFDKIDRDIIRIALEGHIARSQALLDELDSEQ